MKLTTSNTFDFSTIAGSQPLTALKAFIDYANRFVKDVVNALNAKLTLEDNFQGQQITVEMVHGIETTAAIKQPQILGVLPLKVLSETDALVSLISSVNQQGQLLLTPQFKLATTTKLNVTLFVLFPS